MNKLLISIPDKLAHQFKAMVPTRQRSHFIICLLEKAVKKQEDVLYECAKAVEAETELNQDMQAWDLTAADGLEDIHWETKGHHDERSTR